MFAGKSKWKSAPGKGTRKKKADAAKQRAEAEQRKRKEERAQRKKGDGGSFSAAAVESPTGELTSADDSGTRFEDRLGAFREHYGPRAGALVHGAWWLAHNCVAHPLLGVAPSAHTVALHDWTSDGLNLRPAGRESRSPLPDVGRRAWWVLHNCVAHPLIGVLPSALAFWLHDETAERMEVDGWV